MVVTPPKRDRANLPETVGAHDPTDEKMHGFRIDERSVNRYNRSEERRDEHDDAILAAREEHVHVSSIANQWCTQDNRD